MRFGSQCFEYATRATLYLRGCIAELGFSTKLPRPLNPGRPYTTMYTAGKKYTEDAWSASGHLAKPLVGPQKIGVSITDVAAQPEIHGC